MQAWNVRYLSKPMKSITSEKWVHRNLYQRQHQTVPFPLLFHIDPLEVMRLVHAFRDPPIILRRRKKSYLYVFSYNQHIVSILIVNCYFRSFWTALTNSSWLMPSCWVTLALLHWNSWIVHSQLRRWWTVSPLGLPSPRILSDRGPYDHWILTKGSLLMVHDCVLVCTVVHHAYVLD